MACEINYTVEDNLWYKHMSDPTTKEKAREILNRTLSEKTSRGWEISQQGVLPAVLFEQSIQSRFISFAVFKKKQYKQSAVCGF